MFDDAYALIGSVAVCGLFCKFHGQDLRLTAGACPPLAEIQRPLAPPGQAIWREMQRPWSLFPPARALPKEPPPRCSIHRSAPRPSGCACPNGTPTRPPRASARARLSPPARPDCLRCYGRIDRYLGAPPRRVGDVETVPERDALEHAAQFVIPIRSAIQHLQGQVDFGQRPQPRHARRHSSFSRMAQRKQAAPRFLCQPPLNGLEVTRVTGDKRQMQSNPFSWPWP